jgi:hypothetical protein
MMGQPREGRHKLIKDFFGIKFNPMFAQQSQQFILIGHLAMMRFLVEDVSSRQECWTR